MKRLSPAAEGVMRTCQAWAGVGQILRAEHADARVTGPLLMRGLIAVTATGTPMAGYCLTPAGIQYLANLDAPGGAT